MTTPYYEHPEWAAWLASIREQPDDDHRRLFCADWLDELETDEASQRAEWIRGGCAYPHNEFSWLVNSSCNRPGELLGLHGWAWASSDERGSYLVHGQTRYWIDRGFVARVSAPLAILHGGACLRCSPRRRMARQIEQSEGWALGYPARGLADDLMALYDPCPNCVDGRTPGVLGEILRREPLTATGIEVTDFEPIQIEGGSWSVAQWRLPAHQSDLSASLPYETFPTADAARLAFGETLYRLHSPKSEVLT